MKIYKLVQIVRNVGLIPLMTIVYITIVNILVRKGEFNYIDESTEIDIPSLADIIRKSYLHPPSTSPYNLFMDQNSSEAKDYNLYRIKFESFLRCQEIQKILFDGQKNGFFVEAGAMDGEFISNSLDLEKELGWTGLLIEPDPENYRRLLTKNRKSWSSYGCISTTTQPIKVQFATYDNPNASSLATRMLIRSTSSMLKVPGVVPPTGGKMGHQDGKDEVTCFPIAAYLRAIGVREVTFFNLDVEGAESDILLTFPWSEISVDVWFIEHRRLTDHFSRFTGNDINDWKKSSLSKKIYFALKRFQAVQHQRLPSDGFDNGFANFMLSKGYRLVDYWDGDYTFVKNNSDIWNRLNR